MPQRVFSSSKEFNLKITNARGMLSSIRGIKFGPQINTSKIALSNGGTSMPKLYSKDQSQHKTVFGECSGQRGNSSGSSQRLSNAYDQRTSLAQLIAENNLIPKISGPSQEADTKSSNPVSSEPLVSGSSESQTVLSAPVQGNSSSTVTESEKGGLWGSFFNIKGDKLSGSKDSKGAKSIPDSRSTSVDGNNDLPTRSEVLVQGSSNTGEPKVGENSQETPSNNWLLGIFSRKKNTNPSGPKKSKSAKSISYPTSIDGSDATSDLLNKSKSELNAGEKAEPDKKSDYCSTLRRRNSLDSHSFSQLPSSDTNPLLEGKEPEYASADTLERSLSDSRLGSLRPDLEYLNISTYHDSNYQRASADTLERSLSDSRLGSLRPDLEYLNISTCHDSNYQRADSFHGLLPDHYNKTYAQHTQPGNAIDLDPGNGFESQLSSSNHKLSALNLPLPPTPSKPARQDFYFSDEEPEYASAGTLRRSSFDSVSLHPDLEYANTSTSYNSNHQRADSFHGLLPDHYNKTYTSHAQPEIAGSVESDYLEPIPSSGFPFPHSTSADSGKQDVLTNGLSVNKPGSSVSISKNSDGSDESVGASKGFFGRLRSTIQGKSKKKKSKSTSDNKQHEPKSSLSREKELPLCDEEELTSFHSAINGLITGFVKKISFAEEFRVQKAFGLYTRLCDLVECYVDWDFLQAKFPNNLKIIMEKNNGVEEYKLKALHRYQILIVKLIYTFVLLDQIKQDLTEIVKDKYNESDKKELLFLYKTIYDALGFTTLCNLLFNDDRYTCLVSNPPEEIEALFNDIQSKITEDLGNNAGPGKSMSLNFVDMLNPIFTNFAKFICIPRDEFRKEYLNPFVEFIECTISPIYMGFKFLPKEYYKSLHKEADGFSEKLYSKGIIDNTEVFMSRISLCTVNFAKDFFELKSLFYTKSINEEYYTIRLKEIRREFEDGIKVALVKYAEGKLVAHLDGFIKSIESLQVIPEKTQDSVVDESLDLDLDLDLVQGAVAESEPSHLASAPKDNLVSGGGDVEKKGAKSTDQVTVKEESVMGKVFGKVEDVAEELAQKIPCVEIRQSFADAFKYEYSLSDLEEESDKDDLVDDELINSKSEVMALTGERQSTSPEESCNRSFLDETMKNEIDNHELDDREVEWRDFVSVEDTEVSEEEVKATQRHYIPPVVNVSAEEGELQDYKPTEEVVRVPASGSVGVSMRLKSDKDELDPDAPDISESRDYSLDFEESEGCTSEISDDAFEIDYHPSVSVLPKSRSASYSSIPEELEEGSDTDRGNDPEPEVEFDSQEDLIIDYSSKYDRQTNMPGLGFRGFGFISRENGPLQQSQGEFVKEEQERFVKDSVPGAPKTKDVDMDESLARDLVQGAVAESEPIITSNTDDDDWELAHAGVVKIEPDLNISDDDSDISVNGLELDNKDLSLQAGDDQEANSLKCKESNTQAVAMKESKTAEVLNGVNDSESKKGNDLTQGEFGAGIDGWHYDWKVALPKPKPLLFNKDGPKIVLSQPKLLPFNGYKMTINLHPMVHGQDKKLVRSLVSGNNTNYIAPELNVIKLDKEPVQGSVDGDHGAESGSGVDPSLASAPKDNLVSGGGDVEKKGAKSTDQVTVKEESVMGKVFGKVEDVAEELAQKIPCVEIRQSFADAFKYEYSLSDLEEESDKDDLVDDELINSKSEDMALTGEPQSTSPEESCNRSFLDETMKNEIDNRSEPNNNVPSLQAGDDQEANSLKCKESNTQAVAMKESKTAEVLNGVNDSESKKGNDLTQGEFGAGIDGWHYDWKVALPKPKPLLFNKDGPKIVLSQPKLLPFNGYKMTINLHPMVHGQDKKLVRSLVSGNNTNYIAPELNVIKLDKEPVQGSVDGDHGAESGSGVDPSLASAPEDNLVTVGDLEEKGATNIASNLSADLDQNLPSKSEDMALPDERPGTSREESLDSSLDETMKNEIDNRSEPNNNVPSLQAGDTRGATLLEDEERAEAVFMEAFKAVEDILIREASPDEMEQHSTAMKFDERGGQYQSSEFDDSASDSEGSHDAEAENEDQSHYYLSAVGLFKNAEIRRDQAYSPDSDSEVSEDSYAEIEDHGGYCLLPYANANPSVSGAVPASSSSEMPAQIGVDENSATPSEVRKTIVTRDLNDNPEPEVEFYKEEDFQYSSVEEENIGKELNTDSGITDTSAEAEVTNQGRQQEVSASVESGSKERAMEGIRSQSSGVSAIRQSSAGKHEEAVEGETEGLLSSHTNYQPVQGLGLISSESTGFANAEGSLNSEIRVPEEGVRFDDCETVVSFQQDKEVSFIASVEDDISGRFNVSSHGSEIDDEEYDDDISDSSSTMQNVDEEHDDGNSEQEDVDELCSEKGDGKQGISDLKRAYSRYYVNRPIQVYQVSFDEVSNKKDNLNDQCEPEDKNLDSKALESEEEKKGNVVSITQESSGNEKASVPTANAVINKPETDNFSTLVQVCSAVTGTVSGFGVAVGGIVAFKVFPLILSPPIVITFIGACVACCIASLGVFLFSRFYKSKSAEVKNENPVISTINGESDKSSNLVSSVDKEKSQDVTLEHINDDSKNENPVNSAINGESDKPSNLVGGVDEERSQDITVEHVNDDSNNRSL